jgi:ribosomal protein S18 acetylase RimI-like enzyme
MTISRENPDFFRPHFSVHHDEHQATTKMRIPRELEIVLNAPVGPQRLHDDTIVIDRDGWYRTLTPSSSWAAANEVLFSNLESRNPDEEIDAVISEYQRLQVPLTWCVYPWTQPTDLGKRLLARGATQPSVTQAFLGSSALSLEIVNGVELEQVEFESTKAYERYIDLMSSGLGLPPDEEAFRRHRYLQLSTAPNPCMHLFLGRYNGDVAGCSAVVIKEDSGHLTGVYVKPMFQARGVFQSLTAASLKLLRDMGIPIATGHANEQSAFWVKRFGFKSIYSYEIYQLDPPSATE